MKFISPQEALAKVQQEHALLIDVRTPAEFRSLHAAGAENHELGRLKEGHSADTILTGRPERPILVICKSGNRAAQAAKMFEGKTGAPVFVVEGGTDLWNELSLPVEKGRAGISLERQVRIAAGTIVVAGTLLGASVHQAFLVIPGLAGAGLVFAGITDTCGMGLLLARMPWNK